MRYLQSWAISEIFTENSNREELISNYSNILIRAAKSIDKIVIKVDTLERWQRLKIHGMLLAQYLGDEIMEILCREIESSKQI